MPVEVRLQRVTKVFGAITAVDGVTLDIQRGEFFTLLGPSGSGKTTLLRIIAGLEAPSSGRVFIGGIDATDLPPNRRPTSTVFQDLALFPHMTVGQNVEYGLRLRGVNPAIRRARAQAMLRLTDLDGFYDRDPNTLSGGQRQRVALARALVVEPTVLLLDEPLTGLDEKLREQMQEELRNLQQKLGTTFVAVTHHQDGALSMSHRVGVLRDGRLEQVGGPVELYERPTTQFVASFVGAANLLRGTVESQDGHAVLVLGGEALRLPSPPPIAPGEPAVMVIRPERIRLGAEARARDTRMPVEVVSLVYKGAVLEYGLRLPQGQPLRAQVMGQDAGRDVKVGTRMEAGWDLRDTILLPGGRGDGGAEGGAGDGGAPGGRSNGKS